MKIQTYSSTIRRKEMDAVLTCMVEEKTGPGEMNLRLVELIQKTFDVSGAVALRSPALALKYALHALGFDDRVGVMISALAPDWQYSAVCDAGCDPIVLDVAPDELFPSAEIIKEGVGKGGRVYLLHETCGFLPDMQPVLEAGVPVIEDISQSAGAFLEMEDMERKAGSFGVFTILGMEQDDLLTAGGGAVLFAAKDRNWSALKSISNAIPSTDRLPDINAALGYVQLKELARNEEKRRELRELYTRSLLQSRHKLLTQKGTGQCAVYSFPVMLSSGLKDVRQYALKKEIEIAPAFEKSIIAMRSGEDCEDENVNSCRNAASMLLRCVNFPLYPRLGQKQVEKITKVLATMP